MKGKTATAVFTAGLTAALLALLLLAQLQPPTTPILRHVDPSVEAEKPPLPKLALMVTGAFDSLVGGNYTAVGEHLKTLGAAYIPAEYKFIFDRFSRLLNDASRLLANVESLLNRAEGLIEMGRTEDARPILQEASVKLASANTTYSKLKSTCEELARAFQLPSSELRERVEGLREVVEALYLRLSRLLEAVERQATLKETFIAIEVEPETVWTGGSIKVYGRLWTGDGGLEGRTVQVVADEVKLGEAVTLEDGLFQANLSLPYIYKPKVSVQAMYTPRNADSQAYKPSTSNVVEVSLLYIEPRIVIEEVGEALPGRPFIVKGRVESDEPLPYTEVEVSWAGSDLAASLHDGCFSVELYTPGDIADGRYALTVEAPAWKVFAPAREAVYVDVERLPLNLQVASPPLLLAGFPSTLKGEILHGEERFNATVKVIFAGQTYVANTSGEFTVNLTAPLSVLTGYQGFEVYVSPRPPWYRSATVKGQVLVVNPLSVLLPAALASVLALKLIRGGRPEELAGPQPSIKPGPKPTAERRRFAAAGLAWVLDMYWQAVAVVSSLTGVEMKPSMTLREYLAACGLRLGDLKASFEALTTAAEKALYASAISGEELESAKKAFEELRVAGVKA